MRRIAETIKQLLIVNVLFFVGSQYLGPLSYDLLALHYPDNDNFFAWQLVSHMFMHGSIMHIAFNMLGLWMFGSPLEQMWGSKKFLFFYFSTGLGAAGLQLLMYSITINSGSTMLLDAGVAQQTIDQILSSGSYNTSILQYIDQDKLYAMYEAFNATMVGASGALYGVLVAFAFMFPNAELMMIFLPIPIKAKYFVPLLIVGDLFFGFSSYSVGSIAHFAHVGGALTGFVMMWYWKKNQFNNQRWS
ncbi:MAG: rhomboid family intramembrane serine protease [Flavobacteriaceae bacterium]|nr:rhomboid family intramembrane serine protease [Flavobacteriaceae bacterium]MDG2314236.1 rhomboid family intramembrane serine protease [Flavobacteriaceae bacterium]